MITFSKLTFCNILSVGNQPVSIDLNKDKTTLIHGANGSGKSTILDALCYALFGKSFRGVNLGQLINTQNKKGLLVEVTFNIGKNNYLVRRGQKPKVFEVYKNEQPLDAKASDKDNQAYLEQQILKLSFKSFTQIVILGSSNFVPFMQLNSQGRRECVEDFLDIKVFSAMAVMAKERLRGLKDQLRELETNIEGHLFRHEVQQDKLKDILKRDDQQVGELKGKVRQLQEQVKDAETALEMHLKSEETLLGEIRELEEEKVTAQAKKLNNVIVKMNTKLERLQTNKTFYETSDVCHTCKQDIANDVKAAYISEANEQMVEIDGASVQAHNMLIEQHRILDSIQELQKQLSDERQNIFELQTSIKYHTNTIGETLRKISDVQNDTASVEKEEGVLFQMEAEIQSLKKAKEQLVTDVANHDVVAGLLRDSGIKTHIVKKYLPAMNKAIRYHLNELDLPIHFQLDSEFNEQVSSPLHQDFSYQSFSEGQKGRIDLALMFTWREIGRLKNSVSTNILFLDEVFSSSLDDTGKECLLTLLRYRLPDNQRVVVVDHTLSSSFKDKFDNSIEVTRTSGFSRYS